jgi:hypothetical protein
MVGRDSPAISANLRWSIPRRAREARNCDAVMMLLSAFFLQEKALLLHVLDSIIDV